jgi:hypothetical protein
MKYTILSLDPKEVLALDELLRYQIETRAGDLQNATGNMYPEDLLWMTEHAYRAATMLHKLDHAAPKKKRGK